MAVSKIDGVDIYYETSGQGEPLLLIHGAAASGLWFGDLPARLTQTHKVIMPDLRGLGRSQRIAELEGPRVWVQDMWRLLDVLGANKVHIIGVSLGSRIAGRMALERPERLFSLTVDAPIIGISAHGASALKNVFGAVEEGSPQAREWAKLHGPDWRDAVAYYARARATPGLQEYLTVRGELSSIEVPTLICRGDLDDTVHPLEDSFIWHQQTPISELFVAPGMTQSSVMLERPDAFLRAFEGFLQRIAPRTSA